MGSEIIQGFPSGVPRFTGLSIDSRTIRKGEIFFAIIGDDNDGHKYVQNAFEAGAAAAVINRSRLHLFGEHRPGPLLAVDDTHEALLNLAGFLRRRIDARFAAVTGSNGKTTTKEMLYAIISIRHKAFRSPGNLNNLYGLPISLGMMPEETTHAVFELGISVPGEMTRLATLIKPELALITNIGPTHLETLGSIENVCKAKFELIDHLPVGAAIVLNADDPQLMHAAAKRNLAYISFGIERSADFRAEKIIFENDGRQSFVINGTTVNLPSVGRVNVYNALAAIAASSVWGCGPDEWTIGLANFTPADMRLAVEEFEGLKLIIDCYNANPRSMLASLELLHQFPSEGRKIAILGDMLELGTEAEAMHRDIGKAAGESGLDVLFCLGPLSRNIVEGAVTSGMSAERARHYNNHQELLNALTALIRRGDLILFKGSRGMELEKIVFGLKGTAFKSN